MFPSELLSFPVSGVSGVMRAFGIAALSILAGATFSSSIVLLLRKFKVHCHYRTSQKRCFLTQCCRTLLFGTGLIFTTSTVFPVSFFGLGTTIVAARELLDVGQIVVSKEQQWFIEQCETMSNNEIEVARHRQIFDDWNLVELLKNDNDIPAAQKFLRLRKFL